MAALRQAFRRPKFLSTAKAEVLRPQYSTSERRPFIQAIYESGVSAGQEAGHTAGLEFRWEICAALRTLTISPLVIACLWFILWFCAIDCISYRIV